VHIVLVVRNQAEASYRSLRSEIHIGKLPLYLADQAVASLERLITQSVISASHISQQERKSHRSLFLVVVRNLELPAWPLTAYVA